MHHLATLPSIALAIHFYILHIVVDCGRSQGTRIKRELTVHNSNLGAKLCQRPQAIRLREAVAFAEDSRHLQS